MKRTNPKQNPDRNYFWPVRCNTTPRTWSLSVWRLKSVTTKGGFIDTRSMTIRNTSFVPIIISVVGVSQFTYYRHFTNHFTDSVSTTTHLPTRLIRTLVPTFHWRHKLRVTYSKDPTLRLLNRYRSSPIVTGGGPGQGHESTWLSQ